MLELTEKESTNFSATYLKQLQSLMEDNAASSSELNKLHKKSSKRDHSSSSYYDSDVSIQLCDLKNNSSSNTLLLIRNLQWSVVNSKFLQTLK